MIDFKKEFIQLALECGVLKFGEFKLKSGRMSPYFFNAGLFNTGDRLRKLGEYYARALIASNLKVDMLYGPAYKGIPLVSSVSIAYSELKKDIPFAFNRKESKSHGEGGLIVGSPLAGNVLIVDDVITAGTSVRESVAIINEMNAKPAGVLIALDRQEAGENNVSAIQEVTELFNIPVVSIVSLDNIVSFLEQSQYPESHLKMIKEYRLENDI